MHAVLVGILWLPAEFTAEFTGVHGVAHVVSRAVIDVFVEIFAFAHELADHLDDLLVVDVVVVGTNDVGVANLAFFENEMDGFVVVVDMDPVTNLLAGAVKLRSDAAEDVGDLARDEFFDVLVRAVVVGAVRDSGLDTE